MIKYELCRTIFEPSAVYLPEGVVVLNAQLIPTGANNQTHVEIVYLAPKLEG